MDPLPVDFPDLKAPRRGHTVLVETVGHSVAPPKEKKKAGGAGRRNACGIHFDNTWELITFSPSIQFNPGTRHDPVFSQ
jgi:hypothetical protein